MFNILLDPLPTEWHGYKLNTDFRTGIQISQVMSDVELNDTERYYCISRLLFKDFGADIEEVAECCEWFFSGWNYDNHVKSESSETVVSFDVDHGRIYSAFLSQYNINLNTAKMHFWEFMILLSNLEECAFTRVIDIRSKKLTNKMSKEEKEAYKKGKKIYSLKTEEPMTPEEDEALQAFLKAVNGAK